MKNQENSLLLAALLVLTPLTGCRGAGSSLDGESRFRFREVTAAYTMTESQITSRSGTDGRFQFLMFRSFPVNRMSF